MIKLKESKAKIEQIIEACVESVKDQVWKKKIEDSVEEIVSDSEAYRDLAKKGRLYQIGKKTCLNSGVKKEDLMKLYNCYFVPEGKGGRKYYNSIRKISRVCPYCAKRESSQLDHYLPESVYFVFSVTPSNLVPSCEKCNERKRDYTPVSRETELIHPYYDDFGNEKWISAEIIKSKTLNDLFAFEYYVNPPVSWDEPKKKRAKKHFELFKLKRTYSFEASQELSPCLRRIARLAKKGKDCAIEELKENIAEYEKDNLNDWKVAMYQAILDSKWFWESFLPTYSMKE